MFKIFRTLIIIFLLVVVPSTICGAQEITNYNDLIENTKALDGKTVTIKGEAIKEPMRRGDYTWLNIGDGSNAMGIWVKSSEAEKITVYGDYKHMGDVVKVTGILYRACSEHGGDMDIHAEELKIVEHGQEIAHPVKELKVRASLILMIITIILAAIYYRRQKVKCRA